jgi:hypothetical protein
LIRAQDCRACEPPTCMVLTMQAAFFQ